MTLTPTHPDLATIKARQQTTWASGDFAVVASRIVLVSELLADTADLRAGSRVLDIACGSGNATLAAARSGAHVVGVDYVPALLEDGRARALAEGLDVEFRLGDAEDLPAVDSSFDATLSVFGTMFAPNHQRTADEIVRVTPLRGHRRARVVDPGRVHRRDVPHHHCARPWTARRALADAVGHREPPGGASATPSPMSAPTS